MSKRKALKVLSLFIVLQLLLIVVFVGVMDPFYQYHAPYFGMKTVLYDRDNQVAGSLRNLSYDRVLLGSSVAENFDTEYLDEYWGEGQTIKAIRASGSVADLLYYLECAHEWQDLRQVLWCLDIFALTSSTEVTLYGEDIPRYLHTETNLDDITYVFNKTIIFEKIPLMLAYSFMDIYTGGKAYDWSADKEFSVNKSMQAYVRPEKPIDATDFEEEKKLIEQNISMIAEEIEKHPQIQYTFVFPPYSLLWWDCGYMNGIGEQYFYALEQAIPRLLAYENVQIYYYQDREDIVCDLNNYMDMIHYGPWVNQHMLELMAADEGKVTQENWVQVIGSMKELYQYIVQEGIFMYYEEK